MAKLTVNDRISNDAVRRAIYLERYKTHEVEQVLTFLHRDVLPDVMARTQSRLEAGRGGTWTSERLNELALANRQTLRAGMRQAGDELQGRLTTFAMSEAEWQKGIISGAMPVTVNLSVPSPQLLKSLVERSPMEGKTLQQWLSGVADTTTARISQNIRLGVAEGQSVDQIMARIKGMSPQDLKAFGGSGAVSELNRNIKSVVRTSVNQVSTQTKEASYAANDDVIKGVQIVATLDGRTTQICMGLDGKVFPIGEGPRPPFHFNCRTTTAPVTKSWKELGIKKKDAPPAVRASMNGEVAEKLNYEQWLKKQPAEFQNEVLGSEEKGQLFRRGKMPLDRFADANARSLTIGELEMMESDARFSAAAAALSEDERIALIKDLISKLDNETDPTKSKGIRAKLRRLDDNWQQHRGGAVVPPPVIEPVIPPRATPPAPAELPVVQQSKAIIKNGAQVREEIASLPQNARLEEIQHKLANDFNYHKVEEELIVKVRAEHAALDGIKPDQVDFHSVERAVNRQMSYLRLDHGKLLEEERQLRRVLNREVRKVLRAEQGGTIKFIPGWGQALSQNMQEQATLAQVWLNDVIPTTRSVAHKPIQTCKIKGRAFARANIVNMAEDDMATTWIHEAGHTFEAVDKDWLNASNEFLDKRRGTEKLQELRTLTGNKAYKDDEVVYEDKFKNPYMGKYYNRQATEITSMGLEWLYKDPAGFAKEDPEYFEFIVNMLRGTK
jgi:SPP1 gp7 family putative phage head morphogenesis protein